MYPRPEPLQEFLFSGVISVMTAIPCKLCELLCVLVFCRDGGIGWLALYEALLISYVACLFNFREKQLTENP